MLLMVQNSMQLEEFERECEERRNALLAYAYTCSGDMHLAEDIVQETLLIAFRKRDRYFPESDFGAWLIAICRNVWFKERGKRIKRQERQHPFIEEHAAQIFMQENYIGSEWNDEEAALSECLNKLVDIDRELIHLHFSEEKKYQAIAETLNKSLSWVKVRMHRTRKALLECVQRQHNDGATHAN